ncbi:hypothetical protein GCM10009841_06250 [Microlunatus panaciterrae]
MTDAFALRRQQLYELDLGSRPTGITHWCILSSVCGITARVPVVLIGLCRAWVWPGPQPLAITYPEVADDEKTSCPS